MRICNCPASSSCVVVVVVVVVYDIPYSESGRVSHYIIHKTRTNQDQCHIGNQVFIRSSLNPRLLQDSLPGHDVSNECGTLPRLRIGLRTDSVPSSVRENRTRSLSMRSRFLPPIQLPHRQPAPFKVSPPSVRCQPRYPRRHSPRWRPAW